MYLGMDLFLSNLLRFVGFLESVPYNVQFGIFSTIVQYFFCPVFSPLFFWDCTFYTPFRPSHSIICLSYPCFCIFKLFVSVLLSKLFLLIFVSLISVSKLVLNPADSLILSIVFLMHRISVF